MWSTIEVPMGIVCACMPSIRSLFRNAFPAALSSTINDPTGTMTSTLPKISKASNPNSTGRMSIKPKYQDEDTFVPLADMDSRDHERSKV